MVVPEVAVELEYWDWEPTAMSQPQAQAREATVGMPTISVPVPRIAVEVAVAAAILPSEATELPAIPVATAARAQAAASAAAQWITQVAVVALMDMPQDRRHIPQEAEDSVAVVVAQATDWRQLPGRQTPEAEVEADALRARPDAEMRQAVPASSSFVTQALHVRLAERSRKTADSPSTRLRRAAR